MTDWDAIVALDDYYDNLPSNVQQPGLFYRNEIDKIANDVRIANDNIQYYDKIMHATVKAKEELEALETGESEADLSASETLQSAMVYTNSQQYMAQRYVVGDIYIEQHNENHIASDADLDEVESRLTERMAESVAAGIEGVLR